MRDYIYALVLIGIMAGVLYLVKFYPVPETTFSWTTTLIDTGYILEVIDKNPEYPSLIPQKVIVRTPHYDIGAYALHNPYEGEPVGIFKFIQDDGNVMLICGIKKFSETKN